MNRGAGSYSTVTVAKPQGYLAMKQVALKGFSPKDASPHPIASVWFSYPPAFSALRTYGATELVLCRDGFLSTACKPIVKVRK